jgi:general secretion pathway protein D
VFFNRFGKQAPLASSLLSDAPSNTPSTTKTTLSTINDAKKSAEEGLFRRRAVALALAVQFALPVGLLNRSSKARAGAAVDSDSLASKGATGVAKAPKPVIGSFESLYGTTRDAMPKLSSEAGKAGDAFQSGIDLILAGDYDGAVQSLQQVPMDNLSMADGKIVDDTIAHTREAARQARSARADLMIGQESAQKQQYADAAKRLRRSMENGFADAATRQSAARELSRVRVAMANSTTAIEPIHADIPAGTQIAQAADPAMAPGATAPGATTPTATAPATPAAATPAPVTPVPATPVAPAPLATGEGAVADAALDTAAKLKAIQKQKDAYDAQKLVEKARGEQNSGQYHEALNDYDAARRLDPTNQQAIAGYSEISTRLNIEPPTGRAARQENDIVIHRQEILYHFNDSLARADQDVADKKFNDARKDIEQAVVWSKNDPSLFQQPEINDFDTKIQLARQNLATEEAKEQQRESDLALKNTEETQRQKEERYQRDREKTIAGLVQDARQFTDEQKYTEALAVVDNIQRLDPNNAYAGGVRQFLEDKNNNALQRKYMEQFDVEFGKVLNESKEKLIPYSDVIRYSPDWPKISEMRDEEVKADKGEDADSAALQAQLDRHLPDLKFNANSLSDVLDFLRDATGTNIYVDWPALERASIARDAPVTARLHDIKFSKALELIFKSVNGEDEDHQLGYSLDEGVITITTKKELSKNTITRRYDINDLLFVAPDYTNAPNLSLQNAGQGQTGGGGGGGGGGGQGQSLFQDNNNNGNQNGQQATQQRAERVDEIKKYITDNVDTTTWKDNGGDVGSISSSPLRAVLLITQTASAHNKIQSVLDSLRASQALQVSVETRFLIVQRNFLEDIGVNADFEFNPLQNPANSRSGVNSSRFTPVSITQTQVTDNTTFRDANGNVVANQAQGSRTLDWISNVGNAAVPGSIAANPADYPNPLVISGSYVDNMTVTFLIRAVQANVNTTSLTAPKLTLFSGQTAVLIVQTQQAYVSNLTPVVAPGAALFDPQVQTTTATGVVLKVQATVSPDRKYVFMNLQPQLARLRALVPFSISAVVTPVNNSITGTTPQIVSGTLQLPTIDITEVETSCSVPDGATLLLGGQTLAAETTREQGVPVLSKIPFLKRLFTNRATAQDEQILLILVKPTILIQHEQELRQFPQLSSK